ncbi:MAG TPA: 2-succinyl-5-enolpyruvyl-6-hydroxy-3-cyclohexene-1-carboxylic-acid synthase [Acidimicrobiales bacterium]|nr:2-succinyl-5-enolpyruvyl-6-hydroxy-3-cyclohexene-1-carboxylic-acid synthase [Acidimicrobiales bacterium]
MSVQATFSATLVDEWLALGVTDAVVCPGSRSTPLALALAARLRVHVKLDERSGAFFALGLALASGRPAVVCVTSGTAAAELHAAVVEAHHAKVPLIVCTADRPPELHGIGAPQTIEQVGLFRAATRWDADPGVPDQADAATWRTLAARAYAEAVDGPAGPGPVHLNLAFREPLTGEPGPLPHRLERAASPSAPVADVALTEPLRGRGVLVVGRPAGGRPLDPAPVLALAAGLRWPVFADPLSGCRVPGTVAAADAIVRTAPPGPECVVLVGAPWLSRPLADYLVQAAAAGARVVAVDPWGDAPDPHRIVTESHRAGIQAWLAAAAASGVPCDPAWLTSWEAREARAQAAITRVLGDSLNEPQVARAVFRAAGTAGATVLTSASMPIRDLEWYAAPVPSPPRVVANRGANGIDGVVSTALGFAAGGAGTPTLCLLGDLSFLHDVSGLVNLPPVPCTFVVVDNGGGGIFSFLPQAGTVEPDRFEALFGTPPTSDVASVARGFGLPVEEVTTFRAFEDALAVAETATEPSVLHVRVPDRAQNVALHAALHEAVAQALA